MSFRLYDCECPSCGVVLEHYIWVDEGLVPPQNVTSDCSVCDGKALLHRRLVSLTAEYHGEKTLNVEVHGGRYDTAGSRPMRTMDAMPELPADASRNDRKERIDAYRERFRSAEWKDIKAENASIAKENAAKQRRMAAIKRGETVNMRRDKLPGDPKITS